MDTIIATEEADGKRIRDLMRAREKRLPLRVNGKDRLIYDTEMHMETLRILLTRPVAIPGSVERVRVS